jgi:hypothetical protein
MDLSPNISSMQSRLSPSPPRASHALHHKRSMSYFAPSPSSSHHGSTSQPYSASAVPRSPLSLRANLFTSAPSQPLAPPPVSFHRIGTRRPKLKDEEIKCSGEQEEEDHTIASTTVVDDESRRSEHQSHPSSHGRGGEWTLAEQSHSPSLSNNTSLNECDHSQHLSHNQSNAVSSTHSEATSLLSSPDHSRQPSSHQHMLQMLSQHLRGQLADIEPKEEKKTSTSDLSLLSSDRPYVYLQPLVTASAFQPGPHFLPVAGGHLPHRRANSQSDGLSSSSTEPVTPSVQHTSSDQSSAGESQEVSPNMLPSSALELEPTSMSHLLQSNLPPVPETGVALDASFTPSQVHAAQAALDPLQNSDSLTSSLARNHVQEGSLNLDGLTSPTADADTGPKKFTMHNFWAMHDYADEHASSSSDSEAEEAARVARQKNLEDDESDQFDSNPLPRRQGKFQIMDKQSAAKPRRRKETMTPASARSSLARRMRASRRRRVRKPPRRNPRIRHRAPRRCCRKV